MNKMYSLRFPEELKEKLQILADKDGRTLSNLIVKILSRLIYRPSAQNATGRL